LAEAIGELLALPAQQRAEMGKRGREFVARNFSVRGEAQKLQGLLERYARS
jgi:glycosyltransferase involved in cell wall biosynthesis